MKNYTLLKSIVATLFLTTIISQATYSQKKGTMTDKRDGKVYKTITIGKQTWMAENLNYDTNKGSWCYNNDSNNCKKYGKLYDWNTAKVVCPAGWHLPSKAEFDSLTNFLGGEDVVGAKIKSNSFWKTKHDSITKYAYIDIDNCGKKHPITKRDSVLLNSSNFNGLPAGGSYYNGSVFDYIGRYGNWWTSTECNVNNAYFFSTLDAASGAGIDKALTICGFSVRCIKN